MTTYRYRCTKVVTTDYGDGPAAGQDALASLVVIADGSHWQDRPAGFTKRVPLGTRPGTIFRVTIEAEA